MVTKKTPKDSPKYNMPVEVSEWIEQANSRIKYLTAQVEKLKEDNRLLKIANKSMEARVMNVSQGD